MTKRQKWKPGAVIEIPLEPDLSAHAVLQTNPQMAFLDAFSVGSRRSHDFQSAEVLFVLAVNGRAFSQGTWKIVGAVDLVDQLEEKESYKFRR